jgi:hypothetical protein
MLMTLTYRSGVILFYLLSPLSIKNHDRVGSSMCHIPADGTKKQCMLLLKDYLDAQQAMEVVLKPNFLIHGIIFLNITL